MNPREKLVAVGIATVISALLAWYGVFGYFRQVDAKERTRDSLATEVKKKQKEQRNSQLASKRLADYEERSLPPDSNLAKSLYESWLIKTTQETKLSDVTITASPKALVKNTFYRLTFKIKARGELPQLVDFLYQFQRTDWLHRIDSMHLTPLNDSRQIDADLTISALSVNTAPASDELEERASEKMKAIPLTDYRDPIINRNFFGAPNRQPQLDLPQQLEAVVNRTFEYSVKATDPDGLDHVSFKLAETSDPSAKLDSETGKFTWQPKEKGEFAFKIVASDDGLPSQTSGSKLVKVTVKDPPPKIEAKVEPKKPGFDDAKYTVLTVVIDKTGVGEIWLHVRTKGETRILQSGDKFAIGSVKGEVSEIGVDDAILLIDGKLRRFTVGQILASTDATD